MIRLLWSFLCVLSIGFGEETCDSWIAKHIFIPNDSHYLNKSSIYVEFNDFNDLFNMPCSDIKFEIEVLRMHSSQYVLLDNNLNISNFMELFNFSNPQLKLIYLQKIKGFNCISNQTINNIFNSYVLNLEGSKFEFYMDERPINKETCVLANFPRRSANYFGSIQTLFMVNSPFYSRDICPYVFLNSPLYQLGLFTISNSFIYKNELGFLEINQTEKFSLNVKMKKLLINMAYEDLDEKILNRFVFKELVIFDLTGIVYSIENDLFSHFKKMKLIILNIENFSAFFQSGLKWMRYLNDDLNVDLNNTKIFEASKARTVIVQFFDPKLVFNVPYEYPDTDFCLFKDFPHNQLVYPAIIVAKRVTCSCTIYFLIQHSKQYLNDDFSFYKFKLVIDYPYKFESYSIRYCLKEENYTEKIKECNFEKMTENCLGITYNPNRKFTFSGNLNNSYHLEWLHLIIQVIMKGILCIVGVITNFLIIIVIRKLDPKILENSMYKHMRMNSIFNIIYCLLSIFSLLILLGVCIDEETFYCLKNGTSEAIQYYKIYFDHFLRNSVRLCSNFSYIAVSLSRFISTTKTSHAFKLLKKFGNVGIKKFYKCIILISILMSMFMAFEFKVNKNHSSFDKGSPFDAYDTNHCQAEFIDSKSLAVKCQLFSILNMVNNVINNIVFLFISVFIDIFLIKFSNDTLKRRLKLFTDVEIIHETKEFKKRITKMVLAYGILYLSSHLLEFIVAVLFLAFNEQLKDVCYYSFHCSDIIELVQTFNFLSVSLQFFLFKRFDRNFSESFDGIFGKKTNKGQTTVHSTNY
jgi:hypothetical protein